MSEKVVVTEIIDPVKSNSEKSMFPNIVYCLYLLSLVTGGLAGIVGVILAYVFKGDASDFEKNHYRYAIRTFWIGVVYSIIAIPLMFIMIGFVLAFLIGVWLVIRCIIGLKAYNSGKEVKNVTTWLWSF